MAHTDKQIPQKELVEDALISIRDVIKTNLEYGIGETANENTFTVYSEPTTEATEDSLMTSIDSFEDDADATTDDDTNEGSPLLLTTLIEKDGSLTTLQSEETVMAKKEAPTDKNVEDATEVAATDLEVEFSNSTEESGEDLVSDSAAAESGAALANLARMASTMAPPSTPNAEVTPANTGDHTVEDLMRELLRPMLKEWLDAHLPSLVKWLVTEQIEKMMQQQVGSATAQTEVIVEVANTEENAAPAE